LRRSHSATSIRLPEYSPLSPLRLPSLKSNDPDGIPWSVSLNESLRLSHFPDLRRPLTPKPPLKKMLSNKRSPIKRRTQENIITREAPTDKEQEQPTPAAVVQIRLQEPTAITTPHQAGSLKLITRGNPPCGVQESAREQDVTDEDQPRRSVHLYSMRL
jgi:hypothetical protein